MVRKLKPVGTDAVDDARRAQISLRVAVAFHIECITNRWLHFSLPFYIAGAAGAKVDGGLLVWLGVGVLELPSDYSERLFQTVPCHRESDNLIGLDVKTIAPRFNPGHGTYYYTFRRTEGQRCCTAFIVQNPMAPDLVAVIPRSYLEIRPSQTEGGGRTYSGRTIPLSGTAHEYFPLEWAPFIMHIESLPLVLELLREFFRGVSPTWYNPDNGIEFTTPEPPTTTMVGSLLPSGHSDWDDVLMVWQSLRIHSLRFTAERPALQPSVADLIIVDNITGETTTMELKGRGYLEHSEDAFRPRGGSARPLLRPWSSFDLLFVMYRATTDKGGFGLALSWDELPEPWFNIDASTKQDSIPWLTLNSGQKMTWSNSRELAAAIDRILLVIQSQGKFRAARNVRENVPPDIDDILARSAGASDQTARENVSHPLSMQPRAPRRSGDFCSRKQFEGIHQTALEKQLCDNGHQGRLLYLGKHPCGSLVFIPYVLSDMTFHDLHLQTPLVYINVTAIDVDDNFVPFDGNRVRSLFAATHGNHESIYLLVPRCRGLDPTHTMKMYVVPSWELCTPRRKVLHEKLRVSPHLQASRSLRLVDGKHIENYGCRYSTVMQRVTQLCQKFHVRLFTNKLHAVQQFMLLYTGTSFLGLDALRHNEDDDDDDDDFINEELDEDY